MPYKWWSEVLIEETQQEVGARRSSAADTAWPRLVLKTSPPSTRPLRFPKLLIKIIDIFSVDLLMISSCSKQGQIIEGTKFSLDMYGPESASTRGKLVPQELKCAEHWKALWRTPPVCPRFLSFLSCFCHYRCSPTTHLVPHSWAFPPEPH